MPAVHDEHKSHLEEIEMILQYLSNPENLTSADSDHMRAMLAERALDRVHELLDSK